VNELFTLLYMDWAVTEQNRTEMLLHLNYYSFSWHCIHIQLFTILVTKQGILTMDERCGMIQVHTQNNNYTW